MVFTPIPNGVRIVHVGAVGGVQIINTVGCINGVGEVGSDLGALAKAHGDAWRANIVPSMAKIYSHVNTLAYSLEDQSAPVGDAGYGGSVAGQSATDPLPDSVCAVVALKTAKRGRTYQGRMYLSPISVDNIAKDGLSLAPTAVTWFANKLGAYKAAVDPAGGDNGKMAICSRGSLRHNIPPHVEPVTQIIVRPTIGTQRRRLG